MTGEKKDIVIIGGGAGGLTMASVASQLGLKTVLIEKSHALGGDCLHYGCVPSKTLIHSAKVAHTMRTASTIGLTSVDLTVDIAKVNKHVQEVISDIQVHDDPERFRSYGCEILFGEAGFYDKQTVKINDKLIKAKKIIVATGSQPMVPPIPGLQDVTYYTNETIFSMKTLPKHFVIIGGGVISLELAQAYQRFGSKVTIIEMLETLVAPLGEEVGHQLAEILHDENINVCLSIQVIRVEKMDEETAVICQTKEGKEIRFYCDAILVAAGRTPNIKNLQLEKAGIQFNRNGIIVNEQMRSSNKRVYAVGDVVDSPYKFTHAAEYHASIVISNAIFHYPEKIKLHMIPAVIFTDPEIAWVGYGEQTLRKQGIDPEIIRFDYNDNDRALTENAKSGYIKLVIHKQNIVGAFIVGEKASEIISEVALAIQAKINVRQIAKTVYPYPNISQVIKRAIGKYYAPRLFGSRTKKVVAWLNKWFN